MRCDPRLSSGGPADLEKLLWAADFLALDRLVSMCLVKVVSCLQRRRECWMACPGKRGKQPRPAACFRTQRYGRGQVESKQCKLLRIMRCEDCVEQETAARKVSLRALCRCLEFGMKQPEQVLAVLRAVKERAPYKDETALAAISKCRAHSTAAVRLAAVEAVGKLAPQGHGSATHWLHSRLQIEVDEGIQEEILLALAGIGNRSLDPQQLFHVLKFLGPRYLDSTREAAAGAVGALADLGCPQALAALIGASPTYTRQGIADSQPRVRLRSLQSLQQILGDCKSRQVLARIAAQLQDMDEGVRKEALKAVELMARPGDMTVIRAALPCLGYNCRWAYDAGLQALQLVGRGNQEAISGVFQYMVDPRTRGAAAHALLKLTTMQQAIRSCILCLIGENAQMRDAVPECLTILLRQCKGQAGFASVSLTRDLCHRAAAVRRVTLTAFSSPCLAGKIPTASLRGIGLRLLDRHRTVRREATSLARNFSTAERLRLLSPLHAIS